MVVDGLEAAYRRHASELVRYATAMVGPHDARDVVADAIVRVFATADASGIDDVRAYLYRAVHHRVIDLDRAGFAVGAVRHEPRHRGRPRATTIRRRQPMLGRRSPC